jgi:hypothetical protein
MVDLYRAPIPSSCQSDSREFGHFAHRAATKKVQDFARSNYAQSGHFGRRLQAAQASSASRDGHKPDGRQRGMTQVVTHWADNRDVSYIRKFVQGSNP